ncbi:MAG: right-handed parallel beta-helix repeat-containing protein [Acidobacteriia bacterium]|nr:right-handed parallel beta-helix repeat-containing protein [Terriglobia bacterium]
MRADDPLEALVRQSPAGTRFLLKRGVHRLQAPVLAKDGDTFLGEPGATLSGAQVLSGFVQEGQYWATSVRVQPRSSHRGQCDPSHPACTLPEDLFIDDVPQMRAANLSGVSSGKWFLDYSAEKVYLPNDPAGHSVEISWIPSAVSGAASSVVIEGLSIEKFAAGAGDGAVDGQTSRGGWIVKGNEIKLNHGAGVRLGKRMQVLQNNIHDNGQLGISGTGTGILIEGNEVARNNYAGYLYFWEAGGIKFTWSHDLIVRNNNVHDNDGPGIWGDLENDNVVYEQNHTKGNKEAGIFHEVSYRAVIRSNVVEDDGFDAQGRNSPWYGAGILVAGSSDVDIYNNQVLDCMNGIIGRQPNRTSNRTGAAFLLRNLNVHDNDIRQADGLAAGIVKSAPYDDSVFTSWNNRFMNNHYQLRSPGQPSVIWENARWTLSQWKERFHGR